MSEQLMNPAVSYAHVTAGDAIAAELQDVTHRLDYVLAHAIMKLDGPELAELSRATTALRELMTALRQ